MELTEIEKAEIEKKVATAAPAELTLVNCGPLKKMIQLFAGRIYKNSPEKQEYLLNLVCQRNEAVAVEAVYRLPDPNLLSIVKNYINQNDSVLSFDRIWCFYRLGQYEEAHYMFSRLNGNKKVELARYAAAAFRDWEDQLNFMDLFLEDNPVPKEFLTRIVEASGIRLDLVSHRQHFAATAQKLLKTGVIEALIFWCHHMPLEEFYAACGFSYKDLQRICNQDSTKRQVEALCLAIRKGEQGVLELYEDKYRDQLEKEDTDYLAGYGMGILEQFRQDWRSMDGEELAMLQKAVDTKINKVGLWSNACFFQPVYEIIEELMTEDGPLGDFLKLAERVNPFGLNHSMSTFDDTDLYKRLALLPEENANRFQTYVKKHPDPVLLRDLYMNSHYRVLYEMKNAFWDIWKATGADITALMADIELGGYMNHEDEKNYLIYMNSYNARFPFHLPKNYKTRAIENAKENLRFTLRYEGERGFYLRKLYINGDQLIYDYDADEMGADEIWNRALNLLQVIAETGEFTKEQKQNLQKDSCVPVSVVGEKLDSFVTVLLNLSDRPELCLRCIASLTWSAEYRYSPKFVTDRKNVELFAPQSRQLYLFLLNLKSNGLSDSLLVELYMNSFLKEAVDLSRVSSLVDPENRVSAFQKYLFLGRFDREHRNVTLRSFPRSFAALENRIPGIYTNMDKLMFSVSAVTGTALLVLQFEREATMELIVKPGMNRALRAYATAANYVNPNAHEYAHIRAIPPQIWGSDPDTYTWASHDAGKDFYTAVEDLFKAGLFLRRDSYYDMHKYIANLGWANPYNFSSFPIYNDCHRDQFRAGEGEIPYANYFIGHSRSLQDAIWLYMNSHVKHSLSLGNYLAMCREEGLGMIENPDEREGFCFSEDRNAFSFNLYVIAQLGDFQPGSGTYPVTTLDVDLSESETIRMEDTSDTPGQHSGETVILGLYLTICRDGRVTASGYKAMNLNLRRIL